MKLHEDLPGKRVLVVDDDRQFAENLAKFLSNDDRHKTKVTCDGPSALDEAVLFRPHVVVLDISMPGMDGYEVARRIKASPGEISATVIGVTGWVEASRQTAEAAGFDFFFNKPVKFRDIADLIELLPFG